MNENLDRDKWMKEFNELYFDNQRNEAFSLKHRNFPKRLYKYQRITDHSLDNLANNEWWFAKADTLNDPFDCNSTYYDINVLSDYLKDKIPSEVIKHFGTIENIINDLITRLRSSVRFTCFSETFSNMPMWTHYGENHQGFCVEYDFCELPIENDFSKHLYPVGYEKNRYDITNLLKRTLTEGGVDSRVHLILFIMLMKHSSWAYEREWRILFFNRSQNSDKEKCPIVPKAIYFGSNCSEDNMVKIKEIVPEQTKCYKLEAKNDEYFHVNALEK